MRLWSLHPRYLDSRGLVALWREALLAQAVLRGRTKGYRHHPQLERFRGGPSPRGTIAEYLQGVLREARARGYAFDASRVGRPSGETGSLPVTRGQIDYEWEHLRRKLRVRDPARLRELAGVKRPRAHPLFRVVPGAVEPWERIV